MLDNFQLIIGGNDSKLASISKMMFKDSQLVTNQNFISIIDNDFSALYTSAADLDLDKIEILAKKAIEVHYWPPVDDIMRSETEHLLTKLHKVYKVKIRNFVHSSDPTNSLTLADTRKTNDPQIWLAGCSYAYGFGLRNPINRYINIVSSSTGMKYSDLSSPGSSIDRCADQILRSDIREHDIVIWGVTSVNRVPYYIENKYLPINKGALDNFSGFDHKFFTRLLTDNNRVNQSVQRMYQVINYTNKIGAKLIILAHTKLSLPDHSKMLTEYLWNINNVILDTQLLDYTDDGHPGPVTNCDWADKILKIIN